MIDFNKPTLLQLLRAAIQLHKEGSAPPQASTSSLLRLAMASMALHKAALERDCVPRTDEGLSEPLLVAMTAIETIKKSQRSL